MSRPASECGCYRPRRVSSFRCRFAAASGRRSETETTLCQGLCDRSTDGDLDPIVEKLRTTRVQASRDIDPTGRNRTF